MNEPTSTPGTGSGRRPSAERRVARGVVASYIHELSYRHRTAEHPGAPAAEEAAEQVSTTGGPSAQV
jgi:hypothetical protein